MAIRTKAEEEASGTRAGSGDDRNAASDTEGAGGLRMPRAQMLDLARKAAEIVVDRMESLPGENAWEGEFRQVLEDQLSEDALEEVNRTVLARMFWDDRAFMSSTLLRGTFALRMCIVNHTTTWDDVRETLEAVERFGGEALSKHGASE